MIRRLAARLLARLARPREGRPPYAFHDSKGRAYYAWGDLSELPRQRRLEVDAIMLWVDAGRPQKANDELATAIKTNARKAAESKTPKERSEHLAAIFTLAEELLMRSEHLVPEECVYALCAATCIREDEHDPAIIDRAIHQDKIETFRSAGRAGHAFFTTPISVATLGALYTTEGAWQQRLIDWIREEARRKAVLKVTTSGIGCAK